MAMFEFKLPDLGEGVAEGEVVSWLVTVGDQVAEDQEMVEVMTDKATVTIGAPQAGRIAALRAEVGARVPVGSVLVIIDTSSASSNAADKRKEQHAQVTPLPRPHGALSANDGGGVANKPLGMAASAVGDIRESLPGMGFLTRAPQAPRASELNARGHMPTQVASPTIPASPSARSAARNDAFYDEKPLATPATRKLARDLGIDLRTVPPSGPAGRVTQDDLRDRSANRPLVSEGASSDLRKPFVGLRRRIAERMQLSVQKAVHFTFVEEVDIGALKQMVERLKPTAAELGVKLPYLPFIVKAVTLALKKHPALNSTLDEGANELVYRGDYHIGIATATEQGLMVPVVQHADRKSTLEIAREIQRLSEGARKGTLSASELSGSTFTVTSLGRMGGLLATPILNYPEVGILGVHQVKERPVVHDGQIVIGHVMMLSLSFDHRIIDGHVGAAFAYDIIAYLEHPELLLLELS